MSMAIDEELGFTAEHAHIATDRLRLPIQNCLNDFDLSVVLTALTQVFFGTLYDAGLDEKHVKSWTKKVMKLAGKPSKKSVNTAVTSISEPVNYLIINSQINPLAICFSIATAMSSIVRQVVSDESADQFMAALISHIDKARTAEH